MDMTQFSSTGFIRLDDIRDGPRQVVIADCEVGSYGRPDLAFENGDVLSLNKTNVRTLIRAYGEDSRDWVGCTVELYVGQIDYRGDKTDSVLVRPISPPTVDSTAPQPRPKKPEPTFDDEIPF